MSFDYTELQSGDDEQQARDLSLRHTRPPTQVPGYEVTRFLGAGAYGEVWIGLDRNTGRQVAVKFYQHRGGVDWSLLSREVEKLQLLSNDRYVVQLLVVGWQADPPFYVMEFIENGSLEQLIHRGEPRSIDQIVELFREIATGLNHAHAKGILHCDLKPANVLLDQDTRPRLADFGQSRLSDEQTSSLGTLFYMAPEQADLKALPDARWDVYALGAILYCLLVGKPPHHNDELLEQIEKAPDLAARLRCYRQWISTRKLPDEHRKLARTDRALAGIVDRCLEPRPSKRFPNVQSVLDALQAREQARARRPLLLLGVLGPLLLFAVICGYGIRSYRDTLEKTEAAVIDEVRQSNEFAAKFVASSVAAEIDRYYRAIEQSAQDPELLIAVTDLVDQRDAELAALSAPKLIEEANQEEKTRKKREFLVDPLRVSLQADVDRLYRLVIPPLEGRSSPEAVSLYLCGPRGTHLAGAFPSGSTATIGENFAYRSYCHGGLRDLEERARPLPEQHVSATSLACPLDSKLNRRWKLAVSTPIFRLDDPERLLAILVLSVEVGEIVGDHLTVDAANRFAMLVDGRDNGYRGMILDHPMFRDREFLERFRPEAKPAKSLSEFRVPLDAEVDDEKSFTDPFGEVEGGEAYACVWIAAKAEVKIQRRGVDGKSAPQKTGLIVYVQEDKAYAMTPVEELDEILVGKGLGALVGFIVVVGLLWFSVFHVQGGTRWWKQPSFVPGSSIATPTPGRSRSTAADKTPRRKSS